MRAVSAPTHVLASEHAGACRPSSVRHTVTVGDGLLGVERVISLLRQRGYDVRLFTADLASTNPRGHAVVTFVVGLDTEGGAAVLHRRLQRLPSVLAATSDLPCRCGGPEY